MEKMSTMIVELRENCQKLQTELMECKSDAKERKISSCSSVGFEKPAKAVQTSPKSSNGNGSAAAPRSGISRKSESALGSNSSLAGESARKAKSVYATRTGPAAQTKASASRMSSTSSNASVREETRYAVSSHTPAIILLRNSLSETETNFYEIPFQESPS